MHRRSRLARLTDSLSGGVRKLRGARGHTTCFGVSFPASVASPVGPVARSLWPGPVGPVSYLLAHTDVFDHLRYLKSLWTHLGDFYPSPCTQGW